MTSSPRLGPALDLIHSCLWALRCSSPAVTTCGHSIASNSMNNKLLQTPVHESQQHGQPELLQTLTQRQTNIGSGTAIRSFTSNSWLASDLPNGPEHLVPSFCGLQAPPCFASPAANLRHVYQIPDQTIERICIFAALVCCQPLAPAHISVRDDSPAHTIHLKDYRSCRTFFLRKIM